jgi:hypothetical protein
MSSRKRLREWPRAILAALAIAALLIGIGVVVALVGLGSGSSTTTTRTATVTAPAAASVAPAPTGAHRALVATRTRLRHRDHELAVARRQARCWRRAAHLPRRPARVSCVAGRLRTTVRRGRPGTHPRAALHRHRPAH